jgi:Ser/Thr protein kinase RdoA (MazF antagonist)
MPDEFVKIALDAYFDNPQISLTKVMAQGKENISVLVEGNFSKVVVRVWGATHAYMGARQEGDIVSELAFMQFCYERRFPVPKIHTSKSNQLVETLPDGAKYAVIGYVEGETPAKITPSMTREVATMIAELHNAVADFSFPHKRSWPGTLIEMTNDRVQQFEAVVYDLADAPQEFLKHLIAKYKKQLQEHGDELSALPTGVIHGDIMRENIKFKGGKLEGIFDFDDCRESYFLEDIPKTLLFEFESPEHCLFGEDGKNVAVFLDAYRVARPLSEAEEKMLPIFFTARFIYQVLGYYSKLAKDKTYLDKVLQAVARYEQNKTFFEGAKA